MGSRLMGSRLLGSRLVRPERVETTGLDLERDLGTAGDDDPAVDQDVHDVGHEVFEQALIVGDREDAEMRAHRADFGDTGRDLAEAD
jgi:hypothetical protein